jgi:hypothetical protein
MGVNLILLCQSTEMVATGIDLGETASIAQAVKRLHSPDLARALQSALTTHL